MDSYEKTGDYYVDCYLRTGTCFVTGDYYVRGGDSYLGTVCSGPGTVM